MQFAGRLSNWWTPLSATQNTCYPSWHTGDSSCGFKSWVILLTVHPSVFSASGLLRVQLCRVPVWSLKSSSRSKPVVAEKVWPFPGQNWLVQLIASSVAMNLHLELRKRVSSNQWFIQPMLFMKWILKTESDSDRQRQRNWLLVHWIVLNAPSCPDDFRDRGVEVKLGDEAVRDSKENLWTLSSLLLQLAHSVHVSDGVHCRDKSKSHTVTSPVFSSESRLKQFSSTKRCCLTWLFNLLQLKALVQRGARIYLLLVLSFWWDVVTGGKSRTIWHNHFNTNIYIVLTTC